jgi:hypothetical protein
MTSSLSARDERQRKWGSDIYPDESSLDPLPFERLDARKEIIDRAKAGLAYFEAIGIGGNVLGKLCTDIRRERTVTKRVMGWPSLSDDKARLRQILHHARALNAELTAMSMRVEIALNSQYHESNETREMEARAKGEHINVEEFDHFRLQEEELPVLIRAAGNSLRDMPYQARPLAQVHLVEVVAKALEPLGIKPSRSVTSKFHRACEAAFGIANVEVRLTGKSRPSRPSPTGSIRAYMAKRGRHSRWMWD